MSISINEMKATAEAKGKFYFAPDTVAFWGSRIHTAPNRYNLFVESYDNFDRTRKLYAVRHFSEATGDLETIEPAEIGQTYEHFPTLAAAKAFMHRLTIALNAAAKCYREKAVLTDISEVTEDGLNSGIYNITNAAGDSIQINTNNFERFICG